MCKTTDFNQRSMTFIGRYARNLVMILAAACAVSVSRADDSLQELQMMPINVFADPLLNSEGGGKYLLAGFTERGMYNIGKGLTMVNLRQPPLLHPMLGRSRFHMKISATQKPQSYVTLDLTSTNKRCLLVTSDDKLNQMHALGRVVEIFPMLVTNDVAKLPRSGNTHEVCTTDSGELTLYFPAPALDMLRMVIVSHAQTGRRMAATTFVSEMPTN